jgi:hypothetical protein
MTKDLRRWTLECGHTVTCTCFHFVGQRNYCIHCRKNSKILKWEKVDIRGNLQVQRPTETTE